ncbi:DNA-cytosine methyltransferase [Escherichia coli]|uniref:DNA-cytosine methyltransferase n=1 Tax=Escherichia coli TaxID=562 RepID=A0A376S8N2_ECOLX|nr:DNA-cytosine methyltransferase [Escherichia coli]
MRFALSIYSPELAAFVAGFESIGGQCVFTSEWNKHAVRTYKANHYCDPATHHFNEDIRDITLSHKEGVSDEAAGGTYSSTHS